MYESFSFQPYYCYYIICLFVWQVELLQTVVKGVELLIEMEKRLERRRSIDDLLPWTY